MSQSNEDCDLVFQVLLAAERSLVSLGTSRELSLARTKLQESQMWLRQHVIQHVSLVHESNL